MNWKSGDVAICVNVSNVGYHQVTGFPPLRINAEYIVSKVYACECGRIKLDVGISSNSISGITCQCGAHSSPKTGVWWCAAERFVKKELRSKEEQIEEAISKQDFELAAKLRDQ